MRALVLSILLLFTFTALKAQFKGVPFNDAVPLVDLMKMENSEELLYNTLIKIDADSIVAYSYMYEVKAKGYYDALKRLNGVLKDNNIKRAADIDDSYLQSYVAEDDYNQVIHQLRMESGWIERTWFVYDNQWKIIMTANDELIMVSVIHFEM